ncbi:MAG: hypothetical protein PUA60_06475 [Methanobacteriaceae archaeon]|jgi:hypothetical protein|nr:hypothetical protein [Methanobacteriaceae archaeon]
MIITIKRNYSYINVNNDTLIYKVASSKLKDFLRYMNVPGDPEAKKISMVI